MNGGFIFDIKFFYVDWINIGFKCVQVLCYGMLGVFGLEVWGLYKDKDYIYLIILQVVCDVGVNLVQCGSCVYVINILELGWILLFLLGIYIGDGMLVDY